MRGDGCPLLCPRRSIPAILNKETPGHQLLEDKISSLAKSHLDGSPFGRPWGRPTPRWRILGSTSPGWLIGAPVSSSLWGLLVSEMQNRIFYAFLLRSLVFSFVFQTLCTCNQKFTNTCNLLVLTPTTNVDACLSSVYAGIDGLNVVLKHRQQTPCLCHRLLL